MHAELRKAFNAEMMVAVELYKAEKFAEAFLHLETAHVLGQKYVRPHIATHYWMLKLGVKRRSLPEVVGQTIRIVLGAAGSAFGMVPAGNIGGTNISMFKRLPIDPGIRHLMR
jgi:hypothetical protein